MSEINMSGGDPAGTSPDTDAPAHLRRARTGRGFTHLPPVPGLHGGRPAGQVRVYESSAADRPYLWLAAEQPADRNHPEDGRTVEAVVHMPVQQAVQIAEQIMWLAHHHYQGDATPDGGLLRWHP